MKTKREWFTPNGDTQERLDTMAEQMGVTKSAMCNLAVNYLYVHYKKTGIINNK